MRLRCRAFPAALFCVPVLFLIALPIPAVAQMSEGDDANPTPEQEAGPIADEAPLLAGTQYRHVAGSAFVPLYGDAGVTYGAKGCTYMTSDTHLFSNYSLDLPHGSIVTAVRLYFNDTSPADGTLYLAQYDDGASYDYLSSVSTTGSAGLAYTTVSGLNLQLDYFNYNYVMYWVPGLSGSTMQLCGFRVTYTEPSVARLAAGDVE